ncbi:serine carboxypeptidase [Infundibulicybe gibba]|nr:serine carboxypeptidase [Infundibulicybe gibba]
MSQPTHKILGKRMQISVPPGWYSTIVPVRLWQSQLPLANCAHLGSLSKSNFSTLKHPALPHHSIRIKKTNFCDGTVGAYTGYIDIEARHLFFYFFESRSSPDEDDVILWTNGGPCRIPDDNGTVFHPQSWNSNANIFFIDQPVGVGFSYAEYGEAVGTTEDAAQDIVAFVSIFFENFSQFKGRPFHMAGESYGNTKLVESGMSAINLTSVMIGNGMTDSFAMTLSYFDIQCTSASVAPFIDIGSCVRMKATTARCERWMKESCVTQYDSINCAAAYQFCRQVFDSPFTATGKNPYDGSRQCEGDIAETLFILNYLDRPDVRSTLGVDPSITSNFTSCLAVVSSAFAETQDILHPTADYVAALLERGIRVLIYVGTYDWICNWVGNERWTLGLEWSGQGEFIKQELREWNIEGRAAGKTRSANGFTFATIYGAGHMVPYNKPDESLALVQRWLAGKDI